MHRRAPGVVQHLTLTLTLTLTLALALTLTLTLSLTQVRSRLGAGMGVLGAAALLQMALGNAVMRRSRAALDDHERQLGRSPRRAAPHERTARPPLAADGRAQPLLAD